MSTFEVCVEAADIAIDYAESEIREAWGSMPSDIIINVRLEDSDHSAMFFQVTLTGPNAEEITAAVNKMLED